MPPGPNSPVRPASVVSVTPPPGRQPRQQRPYSIGERVGSGGGGAAAGRPDMAATLPAGSISGLGGADELGVVRPNGHVSERPGLRPGTFSGNSNIPLIPEDPEPSSSVAGSQRPAGNDSESSNKAGRGQNRYTITNADDYDAQPFMDALEEKNRLKQQMADEEIQTASGSVVAKPASIPAAPHDAGGRQLRQGWLNAEEEKKKQQDQARRYQQAKKVAEDIQNAAIASMQAPVRISHINHYLLMPTQTAPHSSDGTRPEHECCGISCFRYSLGQCATRDHTCGTRAYYINRNPVAVRRTGET